MNIHQLLAILIAIVFTASCSSGGTDSGPTTPSPNMYEVNISATPPNGGSVSSGGTYEEGTEINIEANSADTYSFSEWTGTINSTENPITLTIDKNYELVANFIVKSYELKISTIGEGNVTEAIVQSKTDYEHGTLVELTAEPADDWEFVEWQGDLTANNNPVQLTIDNPKNVRAVFSSLSLIAFSTTRVQNNQEIWIMNLDGSNPKNLLKNVHQYETGRFHWSKQADQIAFASNANGNDDIWTFNYRDSTTTNLTNHPEDDWAPRWSPDGSKIMFRSLRSGDGIYVMDANGSNPNLIYDSRYIQINYRWSPDSDQILFSSSETGNYEIWKINSDGSNLVNLSNHSTEDLQPEWSPDGSKIIFTSSRSGNRDIWIVNEDGSGLNQLTFDTKSDIHPSWSPDGSKIVFQSNRSGSNEIWLLELDGSEPIKLTDNEAVASNLVWSPDGSKILYRGRTTGDNEIYMTNIDGSGTINLTMDQYSDWAPQWIK